MGGMVGTVGGESSRTCAVLWLPEWLAGWLVGAAAADSGPLVLAGGAPSKNVSTILLYLSAAQSPTFCSSRPTEHNPAVAPSRYPPIQLFRILLFPSALAPLTSRLPQADAPACPPKNHVPTYYSPNRPAPPPLPSSI